MGQSSITFMVTNLGVEVSGRFRAFSGEVNFQPDRPEVSSFQLTIPVNSINSRNKMRDEHLQEEEFFDATNHPAITFTSRNVTQTDGQWTVTGTLVMKGISQDITIPFPYESASLSGEFTLNRQDFQIGGDGFLDTIGDEVKIQIPGW